MVPESLACGLCSALCVADKVSIAGLIMIMIILLAILMIWLVSMMMIMMIRP